MHDNQMKRTNFLPKEKQHFYFYENETNKNKINIPRA